MALVQIGIRNHLSMKDLHRMSKISGMVGKTKPPVRKSVVASDSSAFAFGIDKPRDASPSPVLCFKKVLRVSGLSRFGSIFLQQTPEFVGIDEHPEDVPVGEFSGNACQLLHDPQLFFGRKARQGALEQGLDFIVTLSLSDGK